VSRRALFYGVLLAVPLWLLVGLAFVAVLAIFR
jgi:hypothetical protein